jgi:chorismate lyase/3-hydroxybenzoate synthase
LRRIGNPFNLLIGTQNLIMHTSFTATPLAIVRRSADPLEPPPLAAWIEDLFASTKPVASKHALVHQRDDFTLVSVRVSEAVALSVDDLEQQTLAAYESIARAVAAGGWHAVRFWNHVPSINAMMPDGRNRYMVFNAGRYRAYCNWYGGPGEFERQVSTASGIGHRGRELFVHCLAMRQPGVGVENPRQVAPYHYSKRFGPLPPAFARATVLSPNDELPGRILVGGTASVRGEDSVHVGNLAEQLDETFVNLAALVSGATARINGDGAGNPAALSQYREMRAYVPDEANFDAVIAAVTGRFPTLQRLEVLRADLCRPELLVEIEGVANSL